MKSSPVRGLGIVAEMEKPSQRSKRLVMLLAAGALVFVSTPEVVQLALEIVTVNIAYRRYHMPSIEPGPAARWRGNSIRVEETRAGEIGGANARRSYLLVVNDQHYPVQFESTNVGKARIAFVELVEKFPSRETIAIVFGFPEQRTEFFRVFYVFPSGDVSDEEFVLSERTSPLYRNMLINCVSHRQIGYFSQRYYSWPSLLYPVTLPLREQWPRTCAHCLVGVTAVSTSEPGPVKAASGVGIADRFLAARFRRAGPWNTTALGRKHT